MSSDRSLDINSSPAIDRRLGGLSTTDIYDDIVGPSFDGMIGASRPFFLLPLCSSLCLDACHRRARRHATRGQVAEGGGGYWVAPEQTTSTTSESAGGGEGRDVEVYHRAKRTQIERGEMAGGGDAVLRRSHQTTRLCALEPNE